MIKTMIRSGQNLAYEYTTVVARGIWDLGSQLLSNSQINLNKIFIASSFLLLKWDSN